ncbi:MULTISPECIES: phosphoglycerate dehydrogenase [Butyrivibrio]|jgi:D-3-phosphoglycerate dehydrogenase|uniref:D-3-phosphoglycerate dehydrogenase n=1 Tax=Butyrivibrio hungatei TaxID=185008 RepID=A0A1G5B418_9FIRM|nr:MULTISPECIES: phosphoglycerate dehydrogenase [Butyrivibrio]MBP5414512.1 phosphoglycerate dehydrogenase [Lachnospiraceae bacterium]MBR4358648.1 phosphoglycerate dehydrogenase [Butyrivibrio sp.]MCR4996173.1 phosphoglycerate dehydrogenase [Butyrivibrio sp.]MEE3469963.1 phosphoglycerate dehydrogenase [Butyrivibrio hungatei]SCX84883.1 D-3-phosphoglycerate dehydrogenase [Butyrivibrio hungatei]
MYKYKCMNPIAKIGLNNFTDEYQTVDNVDDAEGILVRSANMLEMEFSDNLLAIARAGAGVNNIPLDRCAEKGIVVFNTPGANANGVKEMVLAAMLIASRDIIGGTEWVKANAGDPDIAKLTEKSKKKFAGTEIFGKKLGIIGLGAIGVRVANAARQLGMDVYGYDPYLSIDAAWRLSSDVKHVTNVDDIYSKCDIITVHVPALDSTKGMINADAIAKMKKGVILINLARDILCNEVDVLAGINSGKIRKYVTDFPNPTTAGHDGCIVIPHLGASTEESEDNCAVKAVLELKDYLENGNINNSVNYPGCDMGIATKPRIAIFHKNVANMISQFTTVLGEAGYNISDMTNKSKGDFAYTLIDLEDKISDTLIKKMEKIDGVIRVRVVKKEA